MSAPKSKARKIIRAAERHKKKRQDLIEKNRKPGETDEDMEARMVRDLTGFLEFKTEEEIEATLLAQAERLRAEEGNTATPDEEETT